METKLKKAIIDSVFTLGDSGGYKIYEWFKLFPEDRERALREYFYLKAYLIIEASKNVGEKISEADWNEIFFALGDSFQKETINFKASYEELCQAVKAYQETKGIRQVANLFCQRAGIGESIHSRQFLPEVGDLLSRASADLRKALRNK